MTEYEEKNRPNNVSSSSEGIAVQEPIGETSSPAPMKEGRTRAFLRNFLRGTIIVIITFGLGALVIYLGYLLPTQRSLKQSSAQLDQASQQMDSLNEQLDELSGMNEALEQELQAAQLQILLLGTISDVRAANVAIIDDNYAGALLSLRDATKSLVQLSESLGEEQGEVLTTLQDDMSDVEDLLQNDPEAAKKSLDRLAANLIKLESTILK